MKRLLIAWRLSALTRWAGKIIRTRLLSCNSCQTPRRKQSSPSIKSRSRGMPKSQRHWASSAASAAGLVERAGPRTAVNCSPSTLSRSGRLMRRPWTSSTKLTTHWWMYRVTRRLMIIKSESASSWLKKGNSRSWEGNTLSKSGRVMRKINTWTWKNATPIETWRTIWTSIRASSTKMTSGRSGWMRKKQHWQMISDK